MPARWAEPELAVARDGPLPYLVEHWYLGPRTRRYMIVRRFREVLEHAELAPGLRVLDLGCGWAYGCWWARARGCEVWGVDLERDQLAWARGGLPGGAALRLVQANVKQLPFPDRSFDRVVSVEMLEHVFRPDRPAAFAEMARVLRPGGRLALSTPNPASPVEAVKRLAVRWPALRRRLPSGCMPEAEDILDRYHPYRYHHPIPLAGLERELAGAGFEVLGRRRFLWVPKTLPPALLPAARGLEAALEGLPLVRRLGATSLVWARRR
ncbi:MAG TPA: class I SAM-dependent methyltransferase [Candidatus Saccharimonadales bacterium]|nr:class I SAM-dependent methyltransferase [Candidatus Saccharimonadales bacterium]